MNTSQHTILIQAINHAQYSERALLADPRVQRLIEQGVPLSEILDEYRETVSLANSGQGITQIPPAALFVPGFLFVLYIVLLLFDGVLK